MLLVLPQEIIDLIIDQVSAEGRTSQLMKTCSLVSYSFHARARTHLFSRVSLWIMAGEYQEIAFRNHRTSTLLLEMCLNPNIKSLHIEGLWNIPYRIIIGNGQDRSLTRITLHDITFSVYCQFDTPPPRPQLCPLQRG